MKGYVATQGERILFESKMRLRRYHEFLGEPYSDWEDATLIVTNRKVRTQWGNRTTDIPLAQIKYVSTKKGGWFSGCHELAIPGAGVFTDDDYDKLCRVADLINSLIADLHQSR